MKGAAWGVAVVVSILLTAVSGHPGMMYDKQDPDQYLNSFLIRVPSPEIASQVARDHGFELLERISTTDYYHLSHKEVVGRSRRSADALIDRLRNDERVAFAEQQITLKRVKRTHLVVHDKQMDFHIEQIKDNSVYRRVKPQFDSRSGIDAGLNDEYFQDQWSLDNRGQSGGTEHIDMNVVQVWDKGITGKDVVVCVLDDGVDHNHEDLKRNYDPEASSDLNDNDDDPTPDKVSIGNEHGTRCAGEIAAEANNGICGAGIAYDARIGGIRILDGRVTDRIEAQALLFNNNYISIYSASWGPRDDGRTMEGLKPASEDALKTGIQEGRNGLGSIFVWASGNGGDNCDHCGADGYVSSIYSISVNALSDNGEVPYFGESCASTMTTVPSGGEPTRELEIKNRNKLKVVTTDVNNGCIENFEGTSSSCPLAAGCLALLLQANPNLTWRDVQHLVALTSRIPVPDKNGAWVINGAGYHVNHNMGFGLMDCAALVEASQEWKTVPDHHVCETKAFELSVQIPRSGCHKVSIEFDGCENVASNRITYLEHVEMEIELSAERRGDIEIFLTSPSGTRSVLLGRRCNDDSDKGIDFKFMTVHNWMENPSGEWMLEVCHNSGEVVNAKDKGDAGKFKKWKMRAFGFDKREPNHMKKAYKPSFEKLKETANIELTRATNINFKRKDDADIETKKENNKQEKASDKALKNIENLFDTFEKVFGGESPNKKQPRKQISKEDLQERGFSKQDKEVEEVREDDMSDREMAETIDEILDTLHEEKDSSSVYLREILKKKRAKIRERRLRNQLISEIRQVLNEDLV